MRTRLGTTVALAAAAAAAIAGAGAPAHPAASTALAGDAGVRYTLADGNAGSTSARRVPLERKPTAVAAARTESWLGLDVTRESFYAKSFALVATGRRLEVWVARSLVFPSGDCRNRVDNGSRVRVTKEQAAYLAQQFDKVIFERQRRVFGVPIPRDGRDATDRRFRRIGRGGRVVVLVDNVRDVNFFDHDNSRNEPYVAGFFSPQLIQAVDRNVVTLDAYDWPHRLRANPAHAPVLGDNCASAPARPLLYEGTLAHEYQHLLQELADPDDLEELWVDEGLADYAMTLSGYARPARRIDQSGFDTHVQCMLGWLNRTTRYNPQPRGGGPENSLTIWGDAGEEEVLCDYGAAYTFMHVLVDRYGTRAASELHREPGEGLEGVARVLERLGAPEDAFGLLHDWAATLALDAALDRGTLLRQGDARRFRSASLSASVNWANPDSYSAPGAPPNGSDYVRLRDATGRFLGAGELSTLTFRGTRFPRSIAGYTVQLIGYGTDASVPATQVTLTLDQSQSATLDAGQLRALFDPRADVVAAIVTYDDRTESIQQYGRYALTVNGVAQPGG